MEYTNKMFSIYPIFRKEKDANGHEIEVFDHWHEVKLDDNCVSLEHKTVNPVTGRLNTYGVYEKLATPAFEGKRVYADREKPSIAECTMHTNPDGTMVPAFDGVKIGSTTAAIMAYVTENSVFKGIAGSIVMRIAADPKAKREQKGCLGLIYRHFEDPIFEDISNDVWLRLFDMANAGEIELLTDEETGNPRLNFICDEEGKPTYRKLYASVRETLTKYSWHAVSNGVIIKIDAISDNENGMTFRHSEYLRHCTYDGAINDVIMRSDVINFFKYVEKCGTPAHLYQCKLVFEGLAMDFDTADIAKISGLTVAQVEKRRADLRRHFKAWKEVGGGIVCGQKGVQILGTTTADDFQSSANEVFFGLRDTRDGQKRVTMQYYADPNRVNLTTKPFIKLVRYEKPENMRTFAAYGDTTAGNLTTKDPANVGGKRLLDDETRYNADFTDEYMNLWGDDISVDAAYDDYGNFKGVNWALSKIPDDYNTPKTLPVKPILDGELRIKGIHEICEYRKGLDGAYPRFLRHQFPRFQERYDDLLEKKRRELGL